MSLTASDDPLATLAACNGRPWFATLAAECDGFDQRLSWTRSLQLALVRISASGIEWGRFPTSIASRPPWMTGHSRGNGRQGARLFSFRPVCAGAIRLLQQFA